MTAIGADVAETSLALPDGRALVLSDGTPTLRFLDPKTFAERRRVTVTLPGGPLVIEWRGDGEIVMTGPAAESFRGTFDAAYYGAPA